MSSPSSLSDRLVLFAEKYSMVLGVLFIYGYYLFTSLDLFTQHKAKTGFLDLFFQFDSLLLMWGVVYLVVQLQKYRKERREEEDRQRALRAALEHQMLQLASLDKISDTLNDRINNPLSIISLSVSSLREKTSSDSDLAQDVETIEGSLKRIQEVMMNIQAYHTKKIMKLSKESIGVERVEPLIQTS